MQILLAFIVGAVIGLALHFATRERAARGVALGPMLGAFSAGLAWTILTWLGVGIDTPWPWLAALVVPAIVVYPTLVVLSRVRVRHDAAERVRLKI